MNEIEFRRRAVYEAVQLHGVPYFWGGNDPAKDGGLDCSGLVLLAWRRAGVDIDDRTAQSIRASMIVVPSSSFLRPGDVAFYGTTPDRASHVVLVLNAGGTLVIGANGGSSIKPNETRSDYQTRMKRLGAAVRIETRGATYRPELLGFGRAPFELAK